MKVTLQEIKNLVINELKSVYPNNIDILVDIVNKCIILYQSLENNPQLGLLELAEITYKTSDAVIEVAKKQDPLYKMTNCKKGCSWCCSLSVVTTIPEAKLILKKCKEKNIDIDIEKLKLQSSYNNTNWEKLGENSNCIFLKDNVCQIYEYRPLECRNYFVMNGPKECGNIDKRVGFWRPLPLNVLSYIWGLYGDGDYLPRQLLRSL